MNERKVMSLCIEISSLNYGFNKPTTFWAKLPTSLMLDNNRHYAIQTSRISATMRIATYKPHCQVLQLAMHGTCDWSIMGHALSAP